MHNICIIYAFLTRQQSSPIQLQDPPLLMIATTHLKSSRSPTGERYRQKEILEVMLRIEKISNGFQKSGRQPALLLAGIPFLNQSL